MRGICFCYVLLPRSSRDQTAAYYLRQKGGYVVVVVCPSVCVLATLRENFQTNLHDIFKEGWQWSNEQTLKFWWPSGSRIRIRIRIMTLVRRALAEVCTVQCF